MAAGLVRLRRPRTADKGGRVADCRTIGKFYLEFKGRANRIS